MKIKSADLIITDPCYLSLDRDWGEEDGFNYDDLVIGCPGFSDYLWIETGGGDCTPTVYELSLKDRNVQDFLDKLAIARKFNDIEEEDKLMSCQEGIGRFAVDSGTIGVFLMSEVNSYDPDAISNLPSHCYHIVRNFTGEVTYLTDEDGFNHIVLLPEDKNKPIIYLV